MKNEKQQQAHNLYFQSNLSQSQIAKLLDVDRRTIYNWMEEGNWRQLKKSAQHIPAKIVEQYYYMLANMNYEIIGRPQQPYPLTHEVKQMRYLTLCIKDLKNRQTINESIEAYTYLVEHISRTNPTLAADMRPYIQDYIVGRAKVKFADCIPEDLVINPRMDKLFGYEIRPEDDDDPNWCDADLRHAAESIHTAPGAVPEDGYTTPGADADARVPDNDPSAGLQNLLTAHQIVTPPNPAAPAEAVTPPSSSATAVISPSLLERPGRGPPAYSQNWKKWKQVNSSSWHAQL